MADKFGEIDARLAVIEANLMVHDALLIQTFRWLSRSPEGAAMKESVIYQLESEAARFAGMPVDSAGRFPATVEALKGIVVALSQTELPDPDQTPSRPKLTLVKSD